MKGSYMLPGEINNKRIHSIACSIAYWKKQRGWKGLYIKMYLLNIQGTLILLFPSYKSDEHIKGKQWIPSGISIMKCAHFIVYFSLGMYSPAPYVLWLVCA